MKYTTFQPKPIEFKDIKVEDEPEITLHIHSKNGEYVFEGIELQKMTYYVQNFDN